MSSLSRRWIAIGAAPRRDRRRARRVRRPLACSDFLEQSSATPATISTAACDIFETAVRYQMLHALALVFTGLALQQQRFRAAWRFAAWAFLVGVAPLQRPAESADVRRARSGTGSARSSPSAACR